MKNKVGRPEVPKHASKSVLRGALYAPIEAKKIDLAAESCGLDMSKWLRETTLREASQTPRWVKSKWTKEQLHGKRVEFSLTGTDMIVSGHGRFDVRNTPAGLLIDIFHDIQTFGNGVLTRFHLGQSIVDKIVPHPNLVIADFLVKA